MRSIASLFTGLLLLSSVAFAQTAPPPAATPPPAAPPPGQPYPYGYPPPPYPYPYPYPYAYPPQPYPPPNAAERPKEPPSRLPYREGDPIPPGYRLIERPRHGLITTGWILTGIAYGISLIAATSADFDNQSGWLAVPFAGPWLTLGRRNYHCDENEENPDAGDSAHCLADVFVVMGLIFDGLMQTAGGALLVVGYSSNKQELVRQYPAWRLGPTRVGGGYGLGASGSF